MMGLFAGVFGHGGIERQVDDGAWLRALLDAEAALARAHAACGRITAADAEAVARACVPDAVDAEAIGRAAADGGNPVIPLVREVTRAVGGDAARHVHTGATSQDIMDTAAMLVARRAGAVILAEGAAATGALAGLAAGHRGTLMAGRTLLQQALPVTFGLVAAGWLNGVGTALERLDAVLAEGCAVQLGGAAGTLASLGDDGPRVAAAFAAELGLAEPLLPWHTDRGRIADLAGALARVSGAVGKAAGDIVLLAQTEVGEAAEAGGAGVGGSSTLPHKRNPVAAVSAVACAEQAPGLAATLLAAQVQQHQRAAGAWQSEWPALTHLLRVTGAAVAWLGTSLERLHVDPARMRANLDLTGGFALAERVTTDLAADLGRLPAHDLVRAACTEASDSGRNLADTLADRLAGRRTRDEIAALLDPAAYLGQAGEFTDRALQAHHARAAQRPRFPRP
ncbi:3-carboxy-cis,cis-muconate cycloisomerase [Nocardiopsis sediminis]|uniref:3-carboxy-cis,cis-muconate cycloisomerase n=1 Tax=Nocardiopsis sediminis TaxID=1778267 RepID=A0ABV8FHH1_9ACTN